MVRLGDICINNKKSNITSKDGKKEGKYPLFYCSINNILRCDEYIYD